MVVHISHVMDDEAGRGVTRSRDLFYLWLTARLAALDEEDGRKLIAKLAPPVFPVCEFDDALLDAYWLDNTNSQNALREIVASVYAVGYQMNRNALDVVRYVRELSLVYVDRPLPNFSKFYNDLSTPYLEPSSMSFTEEVNNAEAVVSMSTMDLLKALGVQYHSTSHDATSKFDGYWMLPGLDEIILGVGLGFLTTTNGKSINGGLLDPVDRLRSLEVVGALELAIRAIYHLDEETFRNNKIITHVFDNLLCPEQIVLYHRYLCHKHTIQGREAQSIIGVGSFEDIVRDMQALRCQYQVPCHTDLIKGDWMVTLDHNNLMEHMMIKQYRFPSLNTRAVFRHIVSIMGFYGVFDTVDTVAQWDIMRAADMCLSDVSALPRYDMEEALPNPAAYEIDRAASAAEDFLRGF